MTTAEALPELPYFDPELRGPRFRETMWELSAQHWLATSPLSAERKWFRATAETFPGAPQLVPGQRTAAEIRRMTLRGGGVDDLWQGYVERGAATRPLTIAGGFRPCLQAALSEMTPTRASQRTALLRILLHPCRGQRGTAAEEGRPSGCQRGTKLCLVCGGPASPVALRHRYEQPAGGELLDAEQGRLVWGNRSPAPVSRHSLRA